MIPLLFVTAGVILFAAGAILLGCIIVIVQEKCAEEMAPTVLTCLTIIALVLASSYSLYAGRHEPLVPLAVAEKAP